MQTHESSDAQLVRVVHRYPGRRAAWDACHEMTATLRRKGLARTFRVAVVWNRGRWDLCLYKVTSR